MYVNTMLNSYSGKCFRQKLQSNIKTHILCSITFFLENRAFVEIMWESVLETDRPQITI